MSTSSIDNILPHAAVVTNPDINDKSSGLITQKPSMRELIEKISGRTLENLFEDPSSNWQDISRQASAILNGVIANKKDSRNWSEIMNSDDVVTAAANQTRDLHNPTINVIADDSTDNSGTEGRVVLKDDDGVVIKSVSDDVNITKNIFENYGIQPADLTQNFLMALQSYRIDPQLKSYLQQYASEALNKVERINA